MCLKKFFVGVVIGVVLLVYSASLFANRVSGNEFNPSISLILDGRYANAGANDQALSGFQQGGEQSVLLRGFSVGHNELTISANIDDKFYGSVSAPIVYHDGETVVELEEAFIETLSLSGGFSVKGGKFFSGSGYLNSIHDHAHDFSDRPLVYDALMGGRLVDTGVQLGWLAPLNFYLRFGGEWTAGGEFPSGENEEGNKGRNVFVKTGGDLNVSSSWQLGANHYRSEFDLREAGGHHHGDHEAGAENQLLDGEVDISGVDLVYKWAKNGNGKNQNVKLQAEYFLRHESGDSVFIEGDTQAEADYEGRQYGFYLQGVYQFMPAWRVAARYDYLDADNTLSHYVSDAIDEAEYLDESGLGSRADSLSRRSVMLDYSPSHFSRLRLQFNRMDNGQGKANVVLLQYIVSLGSHGSHAY